jgi:hypothetical protein
MMQREAGSTASLYVWLKNKSETPKPQNSWHCLWFGMGAKWAFKANRDCFVDPIYSLTSKRG